MIINEPGYVVQDYHKSLDFHFHVRPRPPMVGAAADAAAKVPSLKMEVHQWFSSSAYKFMVFLGCFLVFQPKSMVFQGLSWLFPLCFCRSPGDHSLDGLRCSLASAGGPSIGKTHLRCLGSSDFPKIDPNWHCGNSLFIWKDAKWKVWEQIFFKSFFGGRVKARGGQSAAASRQGFWAQNLRHTDFWDVSNLLGRAISIMIYDDKNADLAEICWWLQICNVLFSNSIENDLQRQNWPQTE